MHRCAQGHKNAGAYFQRTVENSFAELVVKSVEPYQDDLLNHSPSIDGLFKSLTYIFQQCRTLNFKLYPKKCILFTTRVKHCGKIYTADGVEQDPRRTEGFINLAPPDNGADYVLGYDNHFQIMLA